MAAPDKLHVVGREGCPQCDVMCATLKDRGIPFTYSKLEDAEQRRAELERVGSSTFPLVFFGNEFIGNADFAMWVMAHYDEDDDVNLADLVLAWKGQALARK